MLVDNKQQITVQKQYVLLPPPINWDEHVCSDTKTRTITISRRINKCLNCAMLNLRLSLVPIFWNHTLTKGFLFYINIVPYENLSFTLWLNGWVTQYSVSMVKSILYNEKMTLRFRNLTSWYKKMFGSYQKRVQMHCMVKHIITFVQSILHLHLIWCMAKFGCLIFTSPLFTTKSLNIGG